MNVTSRCISLYISVIRCNCQMKIHQPTQKGNPVVYKDGQSSTADCFVNRTSSLSLDLHSRLRYTTIANYMQVIPSASSEEQDMPKYDKTAVLVSYTAIIRRLLDIECLAT